MIKFGEWLREKAIPLKTEYTLREEADEIVEQLYDHLKLPASNEQSTRVRRFEALKCFLANSLLGALYDRPIRYSRKPNNFPKAPHYPTWYTYRIVIPVLDKLRDKGWITEYKGYKSIDNDVGWETRAYPNGKLIHLFNENLATLVENLVYLPTPDREIILRDGAGKEIPFEETEETREWRYDIKEYNSSIPPLVVNIEGLPKELKEKYIDKVIPVGRGISLPSPSLLSNNPTLTQEQDSLPLLKEVFRLYFENCDKRRLSLSTFGLLLTGNDSPILLRQEGVYRVFNGSWRKGGRFFGPAYQGFSEKVRDCILIDNEPTVEKDYSGMLLGMALNIAGVQHTQDPYYRLTYGYSFLKEIYKQVGNTALYSSDRDGRKGRSRAIWALNRKVKKGELWFPLGLNLKTNTAMDKFVKAYPEIGVLLFKGVGLELQFIESTIMNRIVKRLLSKGIFPLIIHDSVRVQRTYVEDLLQVMEEEYEKVMFEYTGKRYKPVIK